MSINNETVRLQNIKSTIERGGREVASAEATLKILQSQETDIHQQLRSPELNVEPDQLDSEIARVKAEVADKLGKAEALLAPPQGA